MSHRTLARGCAAAFGALGILVCLPAWAALPFRSDQDSTPAPLTWVWAVIACVLALAAAVAVLRHRTSAGNLPSWARPQARRVRLCELTRVTPQVQLAVIEYEGQRLLLSLSATQVRVLSRSNLPAHGDSP